MAHDNIGGAEPSTVTFQVATFTHDRGSTTEHQEILILGGQESSLALAAVLNSAPASRNWGLAVRPVGALAVSSVSSIGGVVSVAQNSTAWAVQAAIVAPLSSAVAPANSSALNVRVVGGASSAADFPVRAVLPSTAADNPVQVSGNSTVHVGSIAAGLLSTSAPAAGSSALIVRQVGNTYDSSGALLVNPGTAGSTTADVLVRQSTAADLQATVTPNSTTWPVQISGQVRVGNSTIGDLLASVQQNSTTWAAQAAIVQPISSGTPAHGSSAVLVRQVVSSLQSTSVFITSSHSTALYDVLSSAAAARFVFAYAVTSTTAVPSTLLLLTASTNHLWGLGIGSGSSGVSGANLAVSPPGSLLTVPAGEGLQCALQSGSTGQSVRISVSWFT